MRIISRKPLRDFIMTHPQAKNPVESWYKETKHAQWENFAEIRAQYRHADVVAGNRVIFNLGGNKYRLVVKVAYKTKSIYVKFIGTHATYDKIDPITVELK